MLLKTGVDISRLNREIRRALSIVENITIRFGNELIITSTYEGDHMAGSLHYANDAFDFRYPPDNLDNFQDEMKKAFPKFFDICYEHNHIHIEYDPK